MTSKHPHARSHAPSRRLAAAPQDYPLFSLQREMNRMFENYFREWDLLPAVVAAESGTMSFYPSVDMVETENEFRVRAELPGMDEKDVHVFIAQNTLMIKGEKKEEFEDKDKNHHQVERHWGAFYRAIPLATGIDTAKADAAFNKGVLTVILPKGAVAKKEEKEIRIHGPQR